MILKLVDTTEDVTLGMFKVDEAEMYCWPTVGIVIVKTVSIQQIGIAVGSIVGRSADVL